MINLDLLCNALKDAGLLFVALHDILYQLKD